MLTQKMIDRPDAIDFPVSDRPITVMDPAPGNGWGCLQSVDLVRMIRALKDEQGKEVVVSMEPPRLFGKTMVVLAILSGIAFFLIGTLLSLVK